MIALTVIAYTSLIVLVIAYIEDMMNERSQ